MSTLVEPLIKHRIFSSEEEAIQELVRDYILRQVATLQQEIHHFEETRGMSFRQFEQYLHARSLLLTQGDFSPEERRKLNQAIMEEEDVWFDWKVIHEMLENWLGLRQEIES